MADSDSNDTDQSGRTDYNDYTDYTTERDDIDTRRGDFDPTEMPLLSWEISPYRKYCDGDTTALALALLNYQKQHGSGDGSDAPADHTAEFHCPACEQDVRGVYNGGAHRCPRCGTPATESVLDGELENPTQVTPNNVND